MKNKISVYLTILGLSISLVVVVTLLVSHKGLYDEVIYQPPSSNKGSSSAFDAKGLFDTEGIGALTDTTVIDTFGRTETILKPSSALEENRSSDKPALVVKYEDLYLDDTYRSVETYKIVGKFFKVEESLDGAYIMEDEGSSIYINFDFTNVTASQRNALRDYIQVGRRVTALCREEGRTFVVNSFTVW